MVAASFRGLVIFAALVVAAFLVFRPSSVSGLMSTDSQHVVPAMRGMGLGSARDTARNDGSSITAYDATGQGRGVGKDQDWKVCFQAPEAGSYAVRATAMVGVVKVGEGCPPVDAGVGPVAGSTMPNLVGQTAHMAEVVLGKHSSLSFTGADGKVVGRGSGNLGSLRVCSQRPRAGESYNGVPVVMEVRARC